MPVPSGMDSYKARIRELILAIRNLEQESDGLRAELNRLVADLLHGTRSPEGQGGASVSRRPESPWTSFGVYSVSVVGSPHGRPLERA